MSVAMITVYIFLCLLLGFVGRSTRVGGIGIFLLAMIFTPLAVGLIMAVFRPPQNAKPSATLHHD
ncbi:MAG: hypothetical protein P8179_17845 [Candidatus Thiodiazotropha sp.]|jgi:predicted MFS family arabinose efflux permease